MEGGTERSKGAQVVLAAKLGPMGRGRGHEGPSWSPPRYLCCLGQDRDAVPWVWAHRGDQEGPITPHSSAG